MRELHLSEAQVGFLVSLPLLMFALAAVPGALLVHRLGTFRTLTIGMRDHGGGGAPAAAARPMSGRCSPRPS